MTQIIEIIQGGKGAPGAAGDASIPDGSLGTVKLADGAVTLAKLNADVLTVMSDEEAARAAGDLLLSIEKAPLASPAFTGAATFGGHVDVAGHLMAGTDATLDPVLFGQATKFVVNADETMTGNTVNYGVRAHLTLDPVADINKVSTAVRGDIIIPSTNTKNVNNGITGMSFSVDAKGSGNAAALYGAAGTVYVEDSRSAGSVYGLYSTVDLAGSGNVGSVWGVLSAFESDETNHVTGDVYLYAALHQMYGAGITNRIYSFYEMAPDLSGTINEKYGLWLPDYAAVAPLSYYSWFDSRGVLRVREDNAVDPGFAQAVQALYNPRFAKYTAGAVNHERVVLGQWRNNVAEIGTENGGTGAARPLALVVGGSQKVLVDAGGVAVGGSVDASAILSTTSTTKGFLPPRMTTIQRDAIVSPTGGLVIYNTDTAQLEVFV